MRQIKLAIFGVLAVHALLPAQPTYLFLRNDVPARTAALGGSFVSMQNDPNILFVNPAGLTTLEHDAVSVSYLDHLMDIGAGSFAYAGTWEPIGPFAVGITYYHYGQFDETDASTNVYGTFSAVDLAVCAGTAFQLDASSSAGISVKYISSSIAEYYSTALALDAGYMYSVPEERVSIGISLLNVGTQLSAYGTTRESLPLDLKVGITKRPEHLPVYLNLNFHRLQDGAVDIAERVKQYSFGAEFDMSESLRMRVGYNNRLRRDLKLGTSSGLAGFSGGFGLSIAGYLVDYAYNSYGAIGGLHRFSISSQLP
ncbi:MAG TPA: hypothetical protein DCX46_04940 [Bacteroidetes bacterium]|nr:hypothetical protein [Bacteroidota bacterium]